MYSLNCYNFHTKDNIVISEGSHENMMLLCESIIIDYIHMNQGSKYSTNLEDMIYKYNDSPDRSRSMYKGPFYCERDNHNPYMFMIKEKIKIYGWIYNTYEYKNHISLSIVKSNDVHIKHFINYMFNHSNKFNKVFDELYIYLQKKHKDSVFEKVINL